MTLLEAIENRHSVRKYTDKAIPADIAAALQNEIDSCNRESGLHIQLVTGEPKAFDGMIAHYGSFSGVQNYIALVGKKSEDLDELCGYYGERLVLLAQTLGLNSCWVALSFSKGAVKKNITIQEGEKLVAVISLGYGKTQGVPHKSKRINTLYTVPENENVPDWFWEGMKAAQLAPTALNQQKFRISFSEGKVKAETRGGFYSKIDLGIVKYHFEVGSGKGRNIW